MPAGLGAKTETNPEGVVDATNSIATSTNVAETVQYSDEKSGKVIMYQPIADTSYFSSYTPSADLQNFFSRPISITSIGWTEGTVINGSFDPWHLYFNNTAVKKKLDNFAYMSCNLRVKFVINASPFYYGYSLFSYIPLYKYYGTTTLDFGQSLTGPPANIAIPLSQMPHVNVYPQNCQGGEMVLPFFYPRDWLNVATAADLTNMGTFYYFSPVALQNANSTAGESATIQVLAWAENVKIFGPTASLSMQCHSYDFSLYNGGDDDFEMTFGSDDSDSWIYPDTETEDDDSDLEDHWSSDEEPDAEHEMLDAAQSLLLLAFLEDALGLQHQSDEYQTGPVSSVASAISKAAGALGKVPIIGKYMTATSFLAGKAADVARWFGFTNPPVITDVMPFRPTPFGGFANTDISFPLEKLTLDPKNELSIDPNVVGLPSNDEMAISNLVCRESYITTCEWDQDDAVDAIIFSAKVTPQNWGKTTQAVTGGNYEARFGTPAAHISRCFWSWRGDLIYRFRFIMSKFHRGRARITWDPNADIVTAAVGLNVAFNQIIDISDQSDVEVRIPYMQAYPYLRLGLDHDSVTFRPNSTSAYTHDGAVDNGTLTLRVFTKQTSPVLEADIYVVVTVRAADNFEFANPRDNLSQWSYFVQQSLDVAQYDNPAEFDMSHDPPPTNDNLSLVCNGETILSIRQLLRRTQYNREIVFEPEADESGIQWAQLSSYFGRFPRPFGYVSSGLDTFIGLLVPESQFSANIDNIGFWTILVPMFRGMRGSMNLHVNYQGLRSSKNCRISREIGVHGPLLARVVNNLDTANSIGQDEQAITNFTELGGAGCHLTSQITQAGISCTLPMYNINRFISAAPRTWGPGSAADTTDNDAILIQNWIRPNDEQGKKRNMSLYYSVGADFGTHFFLCVPVVYGYALPEVE